MPTTMKLIAKQTLGSTAADVTFSSIPGTPYTDLLVVISARTDRSGFYSDFLRVDFNGSSANQSTRWLLGTGSGTSSSTLSITVGADATGATATASTFGISELYIPNYAGSTNKSSSLTAVTENNATGSDIYAIANLWSSTAAITSLKFYSNNSATLQIGSSFFLYGITKA